MTHERRRSWVDAAAAGTSLLLLWTKTIHPAGCLHHVAALLPPCYRPNSPRWLKQLAAAPTWREASHKSDVNLQLYSDTWAGEAANTKALLPFGRNGLSHLQRQPQLVPALHVLLVEHPVELDDVGVVGESFQDVVLRLDLLVDVLGNSVTKSGL